MSEDPVIKFCLFFMETDLGSIISNELNLLSGI